METIKKIIKIILSTFQKAILKAVKKERQNLIVGAVAGSGKTFTLLQIAKEIVGSACFCAFNKTIATEIGEKLEKEGCSNFQARTIHSLAFGAVRRKFKNTKLDTNKYNNLVKAYLEDLPEASDAVIDAVELRELNLFVPLVKLLDKARVTLTDINDNNALRDLALHFDIELPDCEEFETYLFDSFRRILKKGRQLSPYRIDFTDQLWLCATVKDMTPQKFDYLLVDECQDLSRCQLAVVRKAARKGTRLIFVGDEKQAINGFAGADCESFQRIKEEFKCKELPLSICYRCPTSHIELAKEIVPQIEARPDAPKGTIEHLEADQLESKLEEGDMILCRANAPLISLCFSLISQGRPARIKGRNIGEGLVSLAKKIAKRKDFPGWDKFSQSLDNWIAREVQKVLRRNGGNEEDSRIEAITDRAECCRVIWSRSEIKNLKGFQAEVDSIFSDTRASIQLSSVHRAKGLEADRVFIYDPSLLPGPWAVPGTWQAKQEDHLKYVALTRSKEYLGFVSVPKRSRLLDI